MVRRRSRARRDPETDRRLVEEDALLERGVKVARYVLTRREPYRDPSGRIKYGEGLLVAMNPPYQGERFIFVSPSTIDGENETYLFPANAIGETVDWTPMRPGSQKRTLSHTQVLKDIGYRFVR